MGVITDLFVASGAELKTMDLSSSPRGTLPGIELRGLDPVKIATLQTLLENGDVNDVDAVDARCAGPLHDPGEKGPWVYPIPSSVTQALVNLDEPARQRIADAWFATEEWQADGLSPEACREWFGDFLQLAWQAASADRDLYVWMSL